MQVHFGTDLLNPEWTRSVVCVGTFDGVHLGHQAVIAEAKRVASERLLPLIVVTFDRHPAAVLAPERCPPAIGSVGGKLRALRQLDVPLTLVLPFDAELAATEAEEFFSRLLIGTLHAECVVVGHDFAMGRNRVGTAEWLAERIETFIVSPFELEGHRVSSSLIRHAVVGGDLELAARLLGRPFSIEGVVVQGAQLGRQLGYPTANLARSIRQVEPPDGVYAAAADTPFGSFLAAASLGVRPTVDATTRTIEAYLMDYKGDSLYGKTITLHLRRRLREQVRFESLDALKEQMAKDVEAARG